MNKSIIYLFLFTLTVGLTSCDGIGTSDKLDPEVEKNKELMQSFNTSTESKGKEFTMEGKFNLSIGSFSFIKNNKTKMPFYIGNESITIENINFGKDQANSVWFPEDYTEDDVKFYDKNKEEGTIHDRYLVSFKVTSSEVEKRPENDVVGFQTEDYEERLAKDSLKVNSDFDLIEFVKLEEKL